MIYAISHNAQERQPLVGNPRPIGLRIKNWVFEKLTHWRDKIMTAGAVYHIAQAFFFLLGGYWLLSAISLATSALLAKSLRDLREFASFNQGLSVLHDENSKYGLLNLQNKKTSQELKNSVEELKAQVQDIKVEVETMKSENRKFAGNNDRYAELLTIQEGQIARHEAINTKIEATLATGHQINKAMYDRLKQTTTGLNTAEREITEAVNQLKKEETRVFNNINAAVANINRISEKSDKTFDQVKAQLTAQLTAITKERAELEEERRKHKEENAKERAALVTMQSEVNLAIKQLGKASTSIYSNGGPSKDPSDVTEFLSNQSIFTWVLAAGHVATFGYKLVNGTL